MLLTRVRDLLTAGMLPRQRCQATWFGPGRGHTCAACDRPIVATDIECECDLQGGATLRFHKQCFEVWDRARQTE